MSAAKNSKKGRSNRRPTKTVDREVQLGRLGVPFVGAESGGEVHGTPSDPSQQRSTSGAYAASSVIERGTARKIAVQTQTDDGVHLCGCGCGQQPSQRSSVFMPGHDSKVRSMGKAIKEGTLKLSQVPDIARQYLTEGGMIGHK